MSRVRKDFDTLKSEYKKVKYDYDQASFDKTELDQKARKYKAMAISLRDYSKSLEATLNSSNPSEISELKRLYENTQEKLYNISEQRTSIVTELNEKTAQLNSVNVENRVLRDEVGRLKNELSIAEHKYKIDEKTGPQRRPVSRRVSATQPFLQPLGGNDTHRVSSNIDKNPYENPLFGQPDIAQYQNQNTRYNNNNISSQQYSNNYNLGVGHQSEQNGQNNYNGMGNNIHRDPSMNNGGMYSNSDTQVPSNEQYGNHGNQGVEHSQNTRGQTYSQPQQFNQTSNLNSATALQSNTEPANTNFAGLHDPSSISRENYQPTSSYQQGQFNNGTFDSSNFATNRDTHQEQHYQQNFHNGQQNVNRANAFGTQVTNHGTGHQGFVADASASVQSNKPQNNVQSQPSGPLDPVSDGKNTLSSLAAELVALLTAKITEDNIKKEDTNSNQPLEIVDPEPKSEIDVIKEKLEELLILQKEGTARIKLEKSDIKRTRSKGKEKQRNQTKPKVASIVEAKGNDSEWATSTDEDIELDEEEDDEDDDDDAEHEDKNANERYEQGIKAAHKRKTRKAKMMSDKVRRRSGRNLKSPPKVDGTIEPHKRQCKVCFEDTNVPHLHRPTSRNKTSRTNRTNLGIDNLNNNYRESWIEEPTPRPSMDADDAIKLIVDKMNSEFAGLKDSLASLQQDYNARDPSREQNKRREIAQHLKQLMDEMESKADEIYALYDVMAAANLPAPESSTRLKLSEDEMDLGAGQYSWINM